MEPKMEQYKGNILVVNDMPGVSDRIADWLAQMGYRCAFVNSVEDLTEYGDFDALIHCQELYFCR
ncbi:hypothetical protein ACFLW8_03030 [Chloroflexota bacterium]